MLCTKQCRQRLLNLMHTLLIWMSELLIQMSKVIRMSKLIKWTLNLVNIVFIALYTVYFTFLSLYAINILMSQTVPHDIDSTLLGSTLL